MRWTDGVGVKLQHAKAVVRWCLIHEKFNEYKENKCKPVNRGLCHLLHLYSRAEDYVAKIEGDISYSADAVPRIVELVHKRDAMYFTSLVLSDLTAVDNTVHRADGTFSAFAEKLPAQLNTFNGLAPALEILKFISVFYLISNAILYHTHSIKILPASSSWDAA